MGGGSLVPRGALVHGDGSGVSGVPTRHKHRLDVRLNCYVVGSAVISVRIPFEDDTCASGA